MNTTISNSSIFKSMLLVVAFLTTLYGYGQAPVGRIFDNVRRQSFLLYTNGMIVQDGNPANRGMTVRDPSGLMNLMLPSTTPNFNAFFLNWNNQLLQIDRVNGTTIVGYCDCPSFANPYATVYKAPQFNPNVGVETNTGFKPLPAQIVDTNRPYGNVMSTSEQNAERCYLQSLDSAGKLDKEKFGNCMIQNLAGSKELAIYNCVKNAKTPEEQTICLFEALGGEKERRIAQQLQECYQTYGKDFSRYPLCMAGAMTDGEVAKILSCMEQQSRTGQVSIMGTAICYGTQNLDLNPETQIMIECAMASGGEPYTFAGCAGGQLLARELDKCLTYGVGGTNGCFGENNDIIKGLKAIGEAMRNEFGPNNDLVKLWNNSVNDFTKGLGPNHEAVKAFRNIGNEIGKAPGNIENAIKRVVPKIKIRF